MKLLFWIVGLPLVLAAAFFAVDNRETVAVSFWPFAEPLQIPLFVAIITPLYVGVVLGAVVAWVSGRRTRSRARSEARHAAALETECAALKARLEAAERRTAASPAVMVPAAPPTPAPVLHRP